MPSFEEHDGFRLQLGDRNPHEANMLRWWTRDTGTLVPASLKSLDPPRTVEDEEAGIASQNIVKSSEGFRQTRTRVRDGLCAIVEHAIDRFGVPMEEGLDIGVGATAEMVDRLMKRRIPDLNRWVQIDVNRDAVREARKEFGHHADVRVASYLHLDRDLPGMKFGTVSGLSTLDSTDFIGVAVEQIRNALKDDGYLFHVQDVRPGVGHVWQELRHEGVSRGMSGYEALVTGGKPVVSTERNVQCVFFVKTPEGWVSVSEMFRRNLGRALADNGGFEIIFNDWVTARKRVQAGAKSARLYHMNGLISAPPEGTPEDAISAIVTVARKK